MATLSERLQAEINRANATTNKTDTTVHDAVGSLIEGYGVGGLEPVEYSWNQIPTLVKNFLDNVTYDSNDYTTSQITNYAPSTADKNNTYPIGKTIETSEGVLDREGYEVYVSDENATVYNDIPNKYTEYVVRKNGVVSQVGTIKPTGFLRQIKCATSNVRDLGGWSCDGGTVKYGKLFRGGEFQEADLDIFLNQLGIRHELNLRGTTEAEEGRTILRDYVGFTCPELYTWYTIADTYKEAWKEILRCVFDCATENKPLFFHCAGGADRTATLACIIEAILGVSQSDIDKDYELTCFATGVSTDTVARRRNEYEWRGLINQITTLTVGDTFRDKVINWVASLGFTMDEINTFRSSMIDGTPNAINLNIGAQTITNTLTNVENSNNDNTIIKYQPYEAEISALEGYAIENVTVTMGGVDITKDVFKGSLTYLYRAITKNLTNCTLDNSKVAVVSNEGYVANLEANEGYTLEGGTLSITMGGIDIMAKYYSNGKITIPNVTGDIVITATAIESASTKEVIPITWKSGYTCNYDVGSVCTESENTGYIISENIPVEEGATYVLAKSNGGTLVTASQVYIIELDASGIILTQTKAHYSNPITEYNYVPTTGATYLKFRGYTGSEGNESDLTQFVLTKQ